MEDGEDFPILCFHSSVFIKNNLVLFGGGDLFGEKNNELQIFNLETRIWS